MGVNNIIFDIVTDKNIGNLTAAFPFLLNEKVKNIVFVIIVNKLRNIYSN